MHHNQRVALISINIMTSPTRRKTTSRIESTTKTVPVASHSRGRRPMHVSQGSTAFFTNKNASTPRLHRDDREAASRHSQQTGTPTRRRRRRRGHAPSVIARARAPRSPARTPSSSARAGSGSGGARDTHMLRRAARVHCSSNAMGAMARGRDREKEDSWWFAYRTTAVRSMCLPPVCSNPLCCRRLSSASRQLHFLLSLVS